jgi:hypothetical protein
VTLVQRRVVWCVIAAVVLGAGLAAFLRKEPSELPVYVLGAQRMLAGDEIYRTADLKPFTYPPFFALPFVPLAGWSVPVQRTAWFFANVVVLVLIVRMLARFYAPDLRLRPRVRRWFWVVLAACAGRHVLAIFENQSHDMLVLWGTVGAAVAWGRGRDVAAGACAGLAAACKATPALFVVPFVLQVSWRALLGLAVAGAAATFLPDLLTPRADGELWVMAWIHTMLAGVRPGAAADLDGTWTAGSILNQSLAGTVYRLTTPLPGAPATPWEIDSAVVAWSQEARGNALLLAQGLVLALVAWCARPRVVRAAPALDIGYVRWCQAAAVGCGMVLLSPMSSKSHFGVLLLPVAVAALLLVRGSRDRVLLVLLGAVFVAGTLTTKGLVGKNAGNQLLAYGSVTWTALLALLLSLRAQRLFLRRALLS